MKIKYFYDRTLISFLKDQKQAVKARASKTGKTQSKFRSLKKDGINKYLYTIVLRG